MKDFLLKPCPFCGNDRLTIDSNGIGDFYVICQDPEDPEENGCGASTSDVRCESQKDAAERWNQRAAAKTKGRKGPKGRK